MFAILTFKHVDLHTCTNMLACTGEVSARCTVYYSQMSIHASDSELLCLLVWLELRGAECSCGDAVSCSSAERGAGHQRPSGCDRATDRLSSWLHQHGPRQPQQVRNYYGTV